MNILVTGGTGTLGLLVTPLLRDAGHDVTVLSRHPVDGVAHVTADLRTGEGIDLAGADTVLHLAGGQKGDDVATKNLVRAAVDAGVRHLVYISVVGADRVPVGWLRMKYAAEQVIAGSGLPWTTLRAAQFHDLTLTVAAKMAKLPVIPVPGGLRFQPVDAADVARRLVELTLGEPAGLVPDLVGPQVHGMGDLLRAYLRASGKRRPMMPVLMPGKAGRSYRAGENLNLNGVDHGTRTWEDFLSERLT
jgi:uncharacterized protein YbjT (DUF2867 family)